MKKLISPEILEDLKRVEEKLLESVVRQETEVAQISLEVLKAGGKRIRPALVLISGKTKEYDFEKLLPVAMAVELIHTASLIHDDIVDGALVRRNQSTINSLQGVEVATAAGDFLFALAFIVLADGMANSSVVKLIAQIASILSQGQLKQMQMMRNYHQTIDDYLEMIWGKTAALFSVSCRAGGLVSQADKDKVEILKQYGENLGMAFQIYDDILDIEGTEKVLGKPIGIDLKDGTVTMPILFALEESNFDKRLCQVIERKLVSDSDINEAIEIIFNTKALLRTKEEARKYAERAIDFARQIPNEEAKRDLIFLGEFVIDRYH